jgi:TolA-binding protein
MKAVSFLLTASALAVVAPAALAQQRVATPEQRIERLERQLQQVQRQVFPRGRPAETAGFSDEPAATQSSVRSLDERLGAMERQLTDLVRQSEENGHRVQEMQTELGRLRTDQEGRIAALEASARAAAVAPPVAVPADPAPTPPATTTRPRPAPATSGAAKPGTGGPAVADAAEAAYDEGYQLWRAGKYDEAIGSLRAFVSAYPRHRRASWANNLVGRAMLDKGQPRAAAEALLSNYRTNPGGARAPDSLFYLGQALMQLGQPAQACKAYAELEDVYGAKVRDELKRLLSPAKSQAQCS